MIALKMNLKVEALVQAKVLHAEIGFRVRPMWSATAYKALAYALA